MLHGARNKAHAWKRQLVKNIGKMRSSTIWAFGFEWVEGHHLFFEIVLILALKLKWLIALILLFPFQVIQFYRAWTSFKAAWQHVGMA